VDQLLFQDPGTYQQSPLQRVLLSENEAGKIRDGRNGAVSTCCISRTISRQNGHRAGVRRSNLKFSTG
jgi:hypothetical protein